MANSHQHFGRDLGGIARMPKRACRLSSAYIWRPRAFRLKFARMIYGLGDGMVRPFQLWQDQPTQLCQFNAPKLTLKHQPTKFAFKLADPSRQGRLRHLARLSSLCEVTLTHYSKKIYDLMQFHRCSPTNKLRD